MATALRAIATCGVSPAVTNRLLDLFDTALQITTAGELADVRLSLGLEPASTDASLAMAEHAAAQGWISPAALEDIRAAKERDEQPPSALEKLLRAEEETPEVIVDGRDSRQASGPPAMKRPDDSSG